MHTSWSQWYRLRVRDLLSYSQLDRATFTRSWSSECNTRGNSNSKPAAVGLLLWAQSAGDIDRLLHGAQQRGARWRMRVVPHCQRTTYAGSRTPACCCCCYYYYYYYYFTFCKPTSTKPQAGKLGWHTKLWLQRQFTLSPWCCGKKPHFLFGQPWKGAEKGMMLSGCLLWQWWQACQSLAWARWPSPAMYQLLLLLLFLPRYSIPKGMKKILMIIINFGSGVAAFNLTIFAARTCLPLVPYQQLGTGCHHHCMNSLTLRPNKQKLKTFFQQAYTNTNFIENNQKFRQMKLFSVSIYQYKEHMSAVLRPTFTLFYIFCIVFSRVH